MLETYDPDWAAKWDRAHAEMLALEARDNADINALTPRELDRLQELRRAITVIFDAKHRTPNEYLALHLTFVLRDAEKLGLDVEAPWLPDDAGIDATRAAAAELADLVEREKRWQQQKASVVRHTLQSREPPITRRPFGFRPARQRRWRHYIALRYLGETHLLARPLLALARLLRPFLPSPDRSQRRPSRPPLLPNA